MTESSAYVASTLTPSLGLQISACALSVPSLFADWGVEFAKTLAYVRRTRRRRDAGSGTDRAGGCKKLLRAAQDVPGLLRQDRERLARVPREMRRVSAILPRERLLGKQIRLQGMWLRQAIGASELVIWRLVSNFLGKV
jgi:hypothetical protein